jgi:dienelactone hydrolase
VALEVPGFRRAAVSVPVGARRPRPLVVALHGNYDRPEWQCEVWRDITSAFPFVLCPRGIPRTDAPPSEDRWHYGSGEQVRKELDAALEALRERFGAYVDDGPIVYTGFSLGAILGERMVRRDAKRFPRAVLTEGGAAGWTVGAARAFADAGGKRVLFACGQSSCRFDAKGPVAALQKVGLEARVAYGGNIGHTYDGAVADAIAKEWQWLVDGDDRWALSGRAQ